MKKVVISIAIFSLAALVFFFNNLNRNDEIGTITITIVNELGETLSTDDYGFTKEDTLFNILDETFELGCANSSYQLSDDCSEKITGRVIMKIDDIESDWFNNYIAIYVNEEYGNFGVDTIDLIDGDTYRFEFKEVGDEYGD